MERCAKCSAQGIICDQSEYNRQVKFDGKVVEVTTEKIKDCQVLNGEMSTLDFYNQIADLASEARGNQ